MDRKFYMPTIVDMSALFLMIGLLVLDIFAILYNAVFLSVTQRNFSGSCLMDWQWICMQISVFISHRLPFLWSPLPLFQPHFL
jgi:hypothetical protein